MKKIISLLMIIAMILPLGITAQAAPVGSVIGTAYHTDIVAYINHYAIPSYAVNGTSVIVAEDLRNFGFDVVWDGGARSLNISKKENASASEMNFNKTGATGSKFTNILSTDIAVYANGKKVTSYAMNGYTMIPMEELAVFGECAWVAEERAIKLWVDNISVRKSKQNISPYNINSYIQPIGSQPIQVQTELKKSDIVIQIKPVSNSIYAEMYVENHSTAAFSFDIVSVNGRLGRADGGKVTISPGGKRIVELKEHGAYYGNSSRKFEGLGLASYGYVVLEWNGTQYYAEFTTNGITTFYRGNARGPAN